MFRLKHLKKTWFFKSKSRLDQKIYQFFCFFFIVMSSMRNVQNWGEFLQSSFKSIYRDQATIENYKLETMCIFWGGKYYLPLFFQNLEIRHPFDVIKSKLGQKRDKYIYYILTVKKNIKFNNYGFFEVGNSFMRPVF